MDPRRRARHRSVTGTLVGVLATTAVAAVVTAGVAGAQVPEPYEDPAVDCEVHDYGTAPPPIPGPADDPMCVRYDKSTITLSTLEALDFVAGEPGRVALALGRCAYWQQDHWVVRATPDTPALVEWRGSYWYDARAGAAAAELRGLAVGGVAIDGAALIAALRPVVGDEAADQMDRYADPDGGGGVSYQLPPGFTVEQCPLRS